MKYGIPTFNFSIRNATQDSVDIYIDGDIVDAETQEIWEKWFGDTTSTSYKSFREQLNAVDARTYNVYINSGGGIVTDAMAIHDLLKDIQSKGKTVNTEGRGIIASAATYILMAGNNPAMSKNSWFMIHNVSGIAWGDVNQVENTARTLRQFNDRSRDFYSEATGISKEEIEDMMNAETWLTADSAKEKGFIKQITGEAEFTQAIAKDKWRFSNTAVLNTYNSSVKRPPTKEDTNTNFLNSIEMKKFFQDLADKIINGVKSLKAPENNDHSALMNSIAEVINTAFTEAGEGIEEVMNATVGASVANSIDITKDGAFKTAFENSVNAAVKIAVENATKEMNTKIANLETENKSLNEKNQELETEITNMKGKPTNQNKPEESDKKRFGSFSK